MSEPVEQSEPLRPPAPPMESGDPAPAIPVFVDSPPAEPEATHLLAAPHKRHGPSLLENGASSSHSDAESEHSFGPTGAGSSDDSFCQRWEDAGINDAREQSIFRLQEQLRTAQDELMAKSAECSRLSDMQESVDREIHELTANLFQEAHKMVTEANMKRVSAEKRLKEALGKIDYLQTEVDHLKLMLASHPNYSPQKYQRNRQQTDHAGKRVSLLGGGLARVTQDNSIPSTSGSGSDEEKAIKKQLEFREVDPLYHADFVGWRDRQDIRDRENPFLRRLYQEDILPCMHFQNAQLASKVISAVEDNTILIEQINEDRPQTRTCALSQVPRLCNYRLQLDNSGERYFISQSARNRIAAVCDFFTYLRYLNQGLIKCGVHEAYWEIIRLRRNMALARLGLGFIPASETTREPPPAPPPASLE